MNESLKNLASDATPGSFVVDRRRPDDDAATAPIVDDEPEDSLQTQRFYALLGPLKELLDDKTVLNIDVNEDGGIWIERWAQRKVRHPEAMPRAKRAALISYLASAKGTSVNRLHSRLQCDMPVYGARVQAMAPDIEEYTLCIRVPVQHVPDIQKYVDDEILDPRLVPVFDLAIKKELSIVIGGNVNTGKTTLLNSLLKIKAKYHAHRRAVVVQDRKEVRVKDLFPDYKIIMARVDQAHHESNGVVVRYTYEFSDALEDALRSNGSFLIWGEVRDGYSAYGLTMAMNTGAKGLMTTLQASSAPGIPKRVGALVELNGKTPVPSLIASVADLLIYMDFDPETEVRRVLEVGVLEEVGDGYQVSLISDVSGLEAFLARRSARRSAPSMPVGDVHAVG